MASSPLAVDSLRKRLWSNGFRPVAVHTKEKRPIGMGWITRARQSIPEAANEWPTTVALNTGVLCDGLVALDIDIDDPALVAGIIGAAWGTLGAAPKRIRSNSARALLLYRAAEGDPRKQAVTSDKGKVELLGYGQQFVAFGDHETSVPYEWPHGGPDSFNRDRLTPISAEAVAAFLASVGTLIGAAALPIPISPLAASEKLSAVMAEVSDDDRAYAKAALHGEVTKLSMMKPGNGRNAALNSAAHSMGTLIANGSLDTETVKAALFSASESNRHVAKHGDAQTLATIASGITAGLGKPRPLPSQAGLGIDLTALDSAPSKRCKDKPRTKRAVALVSGTDIHEKPVEWLWNGYLPKGKLTLLAGDGGTGKSTISFNLAANITTGGRWPDGTLCNHPSNVLIYSTEDDPADTIKPRLMAAGADVARCSIITGTLDENGQREPFDPSRDMDSLRQAVAELGGVSLLVIDPVISAVTGDMHKANDVRRGLQSVVDFAAEMNCAVLGITHFSKGSQGRNSADRVIGSQAFAAFARMVLVAAKEEDSPRRVFTRAKSNNSLDTGGFGYSIEQVSLTSGIITTKVVWGEALEGSSRSILAEVEGEDAGTSQRGKAKQFLRQQLAHGAMPSRELMEHAKEMHGISSDTLRRAKEELGIQARKVGLGGWRWQLPTPEKLPVFSLPN